jgi:hypothetical protein
MALIGKLITIEHLPEKDGDSMESFTTMWRGTIWGMPCPPLRTRPGTHDGVTVTFWGALRVGARRKVPKERKKPLGWRGGQDDIKTIWGDVDTGVPCTPKVKAIKGCFCSDASGPIPRYAATIWGLLPLWDGRCSAYFPREKLTSGREWYWPAWSE